MLAENTSKVCPADGRKQVIHMDRKRSRNTQTNMIDSRRNKRRYSYLDCLRNAVPVPTGPNGSTLYHLLLVGGLVAIEVTTSGFEQAGASFFEHSL